MTFESEFGRLEQLLHHLAFRTRFSQVMLADFESILFSEDLRPVGAEADPVFISGLPRSGTTILLQALAGSGHFASHTYQDMPFVLCPMLWNRFARRFKAKRAARERAHGDGLTISAQTPEGFEEIIWQYFWPGHYRKNAIQPWSSSERCEEFDEFFRGHMARIIAVRRREKEGWIGKLRYLSKNNVNISRLALPSEPLNRGVFLVPYRDPLQQAASLLHQHSRFLRLQSADGFVHRYMEGIGHHDFGHGLRPIDFHGWLQAAPDPMSLDFWLEYWCVAYQQVLVDLHPRVHVVPYARLTLDSESTLRNLAVAVNVPAESLVRFASKLRCPRTHEAETHTLSDGLLRRAQATFLRLEDAYSDQTGRRMS